MTQDHTCPKCGNHYQDNLNRRAIRETGQCLKCDHLESDYQENPEEEARRANPTAW